jgi:peptidyl-prolyl isomerase G (cyclophilin G)
VNETEEEYDARLEREERERQEAERKKILEDIQKTYSDTAASQSGVRFKGIHLVLCQGSIYLLIT